MIPRPNANEPTGDRTIGDGWFRFLDLVARAINGPFPLRVYTVAQLPANPNDGSMLFVSDAGGGGVPVYSRGGIWLRFSDDLEVS